MQGENKSVKEMLIECNKLCKYLGAHPFCYFDDNLVELYKKADPISSSHIEWMPDSEKMTVNIKYFTDQYPYSQWEISEVSSKHLENALKTLYTQLKNEAVLKAKSEIPDSILEHLAEERVEKILH
ncbi:MAG: hypothetical protein Q8933_11010 [Bacteroidota bacterium]|nr:hypothetical protein [Bacteroidota bacterium]MDP4193113.1 hypothetical protein [Bacteroidota bacterium]MDP4195975.1 hypothetical protein [Bacteroidota bacterium]